MIDKVLDKILKKLDKTTIDNILTFIDIFIKSCWLFFTFFVGFSVGFSLLFVNPDAFVGFELDFLLKEMYRTFFIWFLPFSVVIGILGCIIKAIYIKLRIPRLK